MLAAIFILGVVALILFGAVRVVIGWVLPRKAIDQIDRVVSRVARLYLQVFVVGLAGIIIWVLWTG